MRNRHFGPTLLLIGLIPGIGTESRGATAESQAVPVAQGVPQLFIDDVLIESQSGLKRTLHQPVKDKGGNEPLIPGNPGDTLMGYGTIVYDTRQKQYAMYLRQFEVDRFRRATSKDGLTWDQTTQDELESVEFDLNLPVPPEFRKRFGTDMFSCYYDAKDEEYPYKGWLWLANCGPALEGIHYYHSRDGLKWERVRQVIDGFAEPGDPTCVKLELPDRTLYGVGDVTLFSYDSLENRFLGIFKFFDPRRDIPNSSRSRTYLFLDRIDQPVDTSRLREIALLPARANRSGDAEFDEYYASSAWRYGSLWLGGLKIFHSQGDYAHSAAGCAFMKLVVSRDGLNWTKVPFNNDSGVPEVFIPNGKEGGNNGRNDGGYISEFSQGPLRIGDELIYYYACSSFGKNQDPKVRIRGGGVFRARLRVDGFVSVDGGTLTTRPLAPGGSELSVNGIGPIRIEALAPDGKVVGSADVSGDSLRHAVRLAGRSLGQAAGGKDVRLRFTVNPPGRLYSFTVR